jgi:hypothetical protein
MFYKKLLARKTNKKENNNMMNTYKGSLVAVFA